MRYKARDGLMIGGHITVPNGEGPFPLVVLPHGGPEVLETVVYDEWAQVLANNGYMVLQPQYRISRGYGLEHFKAGFKDGALGRAAQDDADDGALYLVEEGLADPDRMAMFGWSYGGYAALVAAARTPQLYQCVIAGAAVADPVWFSIEFRNTFPIRAQTEIVLNNRDKGVRPAEEVEKVNVPVMLVHGDVDQRVQSYNAKRYADLLEKHGKPYKLAKARRCRSLLQHAVLRAPARTLRVDDRLPGERLRHAAAIAGELVRLGYAASRTSRWGPAHRRWASRDS